MPKDMAEVRREIKHLFDKHRMEIVDHMPVRVDKYEYVIVRRDWFDGTVYFSGIEDHATLMQYLDPMVQIVKTTDPIIEVYSRHLPLDAQLRQSKAWNIEPANDPLEEAKAIMASLSAWIQNDQGWPRNERRCHDIVKQAERFLDEH